MQYYKYSLAAVAVVVGSEVILRCLKHVCNLLHHKDKFPLTENEYEGKGQMAVSKVIFFPDQGIVSRLNNVNGESKHNLIPQERDKMSATNGCKSITERSHVTSVNYNSALLPQDEASSSPFLRKSTSLIHLVSALDSAKHSLKICMYIFTCKDLVAAVVRAKRRGVSVRVVLEGHMPSEAAIVTFRKYNIPLRLSQATFLMHHKFALVDTPDSRYHNAAQGKVPNTTNSNICEGSWLGRFASYLGCGSSVTLGAQGAEKSASASKPVLLTGSFNWTWSAVISNSESVIITSDPNLISAYNSEFEALWENLRDLKLPQK